ncbi:callose synthase 10 isoform X1 [Lactuca sativa]|uniref:callose synthase 10 isoform X1 n=1 Tax=Lactuca sativa TaxID=4236 RepID=UPI000CD8FC56|nr:callose synthase 10 isoform X1 [Lactuca sativa]XP_042756311.1 callose synthase 10 isoform X1 [Lactuca sativa]XP_042756312.1 callose synthase 10 isoform X1 [Lactuca sativa]
MKWCTYLNILLMWNKVRMHDGYPDAFDRVVHITQGDISKDIYAGCKGMRCWAESDCSVCEQVLSMDIYKLGQHFDLFRINSFYFTIVGFYFCTMLPMITMYIFFLLKNVFD